MRKEIYLKPTIREVRPGDRMEYLLAASGSGKYGVSVDDTTVTNTNEAKEENPDEIDAKHHQGNMGLWED